MIVAVKKRAVRSSTIPQVSQSMQKLQSLMEMMTRMPANPFADKDEAYRSVGCDSKAAPYIYPFL